MVDIKNDLTSLFSVIGEKKFDIQYKPVMIVDENNFNYTNEKSYDLQELPYVSIEDLTEWDLNFIARSVKMASPKHPELKKMLNEYMTMMAIYGEL